MPCYLFTYHSYRSWMPNHPEGYVSRGEGVLPPDLKRSRQYSYVASEDKSIFQNEHQQNIIRCIRIACTDHLSARCHGITTEATHVHILISWKSQRSWSSIRTSIKRAMSCSLNEEFGKHRWFSESASRKQICDQDHFNYLMTKYFPNHRGLSWFEQI